MTPVLKGVTIVGGIGATVGGGFLVNSLINQDKPKSTLARKLEEDKFTLLNFDTNKTEEQESGWKKILTSYSSLIKTKPELKIEGLTLEDSDTEGINKLKKACSSVLKVEEGSSNFVNSYKLASKWCVEPISISVLLSKRGIPYLNTEASQDTALWTEIAKQYEKDKKANKSTMMNDLTWDEVTGDNYETNIGKIKTACINRKTKNSHEDEFEKKLEEARMWCTAIKSSKQ